MLTCLLSIAKATDENLTSENWEYILVRMADLPYFGPRIHQLMGYWDRMSVTRCLRIALGKLWKLRGGVWAGVYADGVWVRAKDAVAAMIRRLAHRNANVQLYTLEVCCCCYWR